MTNSRQSMMRTSEPPHLASCSRRAETLRRRHACRMNHAMRGPRAQHYGEEIMSTNLGTMEDLPLEYRQAVEQANTTPLWPLMRKALPHDTPVPQSKACLWAYDTIRPL